MIEAVKDFLAGKPHAKRSSKWPAVRKEHLQRRPVCEVCGSKKNLNVHHIYPVHLAPEGELAPENLITLCEGKAVNHHLLFGHLGNWRSFNSSVVQDCIIWNHKIFTRPK